MTFAFRYGVGHMYNQNSNYYILLCNAVIINENNSFDYWDNIYDSDSRNTRE